MSSQQCISSFISSLAQCIAWAMIVALWLHTCLLGTDVQRHDFVVASLGYILLLYSCMALQSCMQHRFEYKYICSIQNLAAPQHPHRCKLDQSQTVCSFCLELVFNLEGCTAAMQLCKNSLSHFRPVCRLFVNSRNGTTTWSECMRTLGNPFAPCAPPQAVCRIHPQVVKDLHKSAQSVSVQLSHGCDVPTKDRHCSM